MRELFLNVLEASFYGGILIMAVCLFRTMFRNVPKASICLLWLLVGLRLVLPVHIESSLSLQPDSPVAELRMEQTQLSDSRTEIDVLPEIGQTSNGEQNVSVEQQTPEYTAPADLSEIDTDRYEAEEPVDWLEIASVVWLVGAVGMLAYTAVSYLRLKRRVRDAEPAGENIFLCPGLDTAFVLGVLKPGIYLPGELDGADREFVLAHERSHIARGDHLSKFAAFAVLAVHWFNPLVWVSYVLLCRDLEMACDERVVKNMDVTQRKAYSTALLSCAAKRSGLAFCPVAFGEVGVKERILRVLRYRKPGFWLTIAAVVALIVATVCFLTEPAMEEEPAETTLPAETEPELWTGVDEATAEELTALFTDPESWYYMALCSDYIAPEFMEVREFFYQGTDGERVYFTEEDLDSISAEGQSRLALEASNHKVDPDRANEILGEVLGITMEDLRNPNTSYTGIHYYEEIDCWSVNNTRPWWGWVEGEYENVVEVLGSQALENGDIAITYTDGRNANRIVTVRNVDGVWKVRSNLLAADVKAYSTDYSAQELPWSVPETMSYEEYFSEVRNYTENDRYGYSGTGWLSDYIIECDGYHMVVRKESTKSGVNANMNQEIIWVIPSEVDFSQCFIRYKTQKWLFGRKGNEIFRVDYYGNYETLFVDETGMLSQTRESGWASTLMDQTIWFVAGVNEGEPHPGIYRLYMPTGQVDLIYDDFPSYADGVDGNGWSLPAKVSAAYSNVEVAWTQSNEAFWTTYYAMVDDETSVLYTDEKYQGYSLTQEAMPSMLLADDLDVDPSLASHYNALSGELHQTVIGRASSELSFDQIQYEHLRWWE